MVQRDGRVNVIIPRNKRHKDTFLKYPSSRIYKYFLVATSFWLLIHLFTIISTTQNPTTSSSSNRRGLESMLSVSNAHNQRHNNHYFYNDNNQHHLIPPLNESFSIIGGILQSHHHHYHNHTHSKHADQAARRAKVLAKMKQRQENRNQTVLQEWQQSGGSSSRRWMLDFRSRYDNYYLSTTNSSSSSGSGTSAAHSALRPGAVLPTTNVPLPDMTTNRGGVIVFWHVPKTGGQTIRHNFGLIMGHVQQSSIRQKLLNEIQPHVRRQQLFMNSSTTTILKKKVQFLWANYLDIFLYQAIGRIQPRFTIIPCLSNKLLTMGRPGVNGFIYLIKSWTPISEQSFQTVF